ncbi:MAG TPA: J domain-containing protein [Pyrinomonadaceae bacterium]|nr:J domain-containing protein [Pyrinomonadaceae bacterium]
MVKDEDYATLDIEVGTSMDGITAAYRDLVAVWHPDNFGHSPRLQEKAVEKMKKITLAYERLCRLTPSDQETQPDDSQSSAQIIDKREVAKSLDQNSFPTRSVVKWVGERFVFLPIETAQEYGYMSVFSTKDRSVDYLPYREYVGRMAKVTKVEPCAYDLELVLEDTGEKVYGTVSYGVIKDMALVADIENARALYVGKTLWTEETVHTCTADGYIERTGEEELNTPLGFFPVKVINVVAGWDAEKPVRFVVQLPSGKEGYIDVQMSDTNISESLRYRTRFEEVFHLEYPNE